MTHSIMTHSIPITIAEGDGIGPEIMQATLDILKATGAPLDITKIEIGEKAYLKGEMSGIHQESWEIIKSGKGFLKAPITTPQGGGYKSLNVTIRGALGLYANVRPCVSYAPFVETKHPKIDVVIIRENEEDLYMGIEYRHTPQWVQAIKAMTTKGCEKIIRYAFEYAKATGRKKVSCFTKDNILKLSDGLFHRTFDDIAKEYEEIENEHWIIDIGSAKLANKPADFDVVVLPNLYGDILSDVAAEIAGSVGLAGSANIGTKGAMFEAIHGSAPRRANQNVANPSGLILASSMMMAHIGLPDTASLIHNAWLATIEDGIHTYDIFKEGISIEKVGTKEFAKAVIKRLGKKPKTLKEIHYSSLKNVGHVEEKVTSISSKKELVGVDVFIQSEEDIAKIQSCISALKTKGLILSKIANRGVKVWPDPNHHPNYSDNWRLRFLSLQAGHPIAHADIVQLLHLMAEAKIDFTQVQALCTFDGKAGYSE